jgi:hypothetical protein
MAQAGYCSECGTDVGLTPEGGCPAGHGAECISDTRQAPDVAAEAPEEPEAPAAPPAQPAPTLPVTPERNRSGLIVIVIAAVLILGACLATGLLIGPAIQKARTAKTATAANTPERAKVLATVGFLKVLFAEDAMAIKPYLVDSAQSAITDAQWKSIASAIPTVAVTVGTPKWSTDTTAVVSLTVAEATGTLTAGAIVATDAVSMELSAGGTTDGAVVSLVKVGAGWRILAVTGSAGDRTVYDAAFVKQMLADVSKN